ncbi:MAG: hypothetical protein V5A59_03385 [Bacteroidales bacterium]|nr:hypothetical protein [Bacteroidales bacterium]
MGKDQKDDANEPLSDYGQPLTFEKVWQMFQETDRMFKETGKKFEETDRKIDRLAKLYGGVSENSRDVAEEFFRRGLEARDALFGIPYDQVARLEKRTRQLQGEYDIVLYNGEYMIVIEVKYKLHPDDVEDFLNRKLPAFKPLFPEYSDQKLIGAVAGMSVPADSYETAEKNGLLVLTQSGENISVMNPRDFVIKEF